MNAGPDHAKARAQAQANADRDGQARQIWMYNGVWWIERVGLSERGEHTSTVPDAEIIEPRRYHAVAVSKYAGMYRARDPIAWAIADHQEANRIVSQKYETLADAERAAAAMNARRLGPTD